MARLTVLAPEQLPAEVRERVGGVAPAQLGSLGVWALQPQLALALLDLKAALSRFSLPPRLLELVRLRGRSTTSAAAACRFGAPRRSRTG